MGRRGFNPMAHSVGTSGGWKSRKMDVASAFLRSDPPARRVWLTPPPKAEVGEDKVRRRGKSIYGSAETLSAFDRTLTKFVPKGEARGQQLGVTLSMSRQDPRLFFARNTDGGSSWGAYWRGRVFLVTFAALRRLCLGNNGRLTLRSLTAGFECRPIRADLLWGTSGIFHV